MVIQCSHCQTRFKLADDKLKPEGTKVRCSKCREIFTVFPPEAEPSAAPPPEPEVTAPAPAVAGGESSPVDEFAFDAAPRTPADDHEFSFDVDDIAAHAPAPAGEDFGWSFDAKTPAAPAASAQESFDSAVDSTDTPESAAFQFDDAGQGTDNAFDFGTSTNEDAAFSFSSETAAPAFETAPAQATEGGFDEFAFDDTASSPGETAFAFDSPPPEQGGLSEFSFDAGPSDGFSWESNHAEGESQQESPPAAAPPIPGEFGDFDFSGLSFGEEEPAGSSVTAADTERIALDNDDADATRTFAAAAAGGMSAAGATMVMKRAESSLNGEEPVPAKSTPAAAPKSTAPSRKGVSPQLVKGILVLSVLGAVGGGVYFVQQQGFDFQQTISNFIDRKAPEVAVGQIELGNLSSQFVKSSAGELFVIRGTAINQFKTARSAIQVKGVLYDKGGKVLKQQVAFCGNPLDDATLRSAGYAKIEEAMSNQFGDSMLNLNVAVGKGIPFAIVFKEAPPALAEFTVEIVDSKPGSK